MHTEGVAEHSLKLQPSIRLHAPLQPLCSAALVPSEDHFSRYRGDQSFKLYYSLLIIINQITVKTKLIGIYKCNLLIFFKTAKQNKKSLPKTRFYFLFAL